MAGQGFDTSVWQNVTSGWLGERSPQFREAMRDQARMRDYAPGEHPHHIGDEPGGIYGVAAGSFGVYVLSEAEGVALAHIFREGAWFGQGPVVSGKPRYLAFRAIEPSTVVTLTPSALAHVLETVPGAERELMSLSEYNQTIMSRAVADLLIRKTECRVAAVLLRLFTIGSGGGYLLRPFKLTQSDLSEMANTSRHTTNTILKSFEAQGWIDMSYGCIALKDIEALRRCAWG